MAKFPLPHFGELDTQNLESYYKVDIPFDDHEIKVDLNFDSGNIDIKGLETVAKFIDSILAYDIRNRQYIEQDFVDEDCDTVKTYVEHHLEEISKEELSNLVDFDNENISPKLQLINALKLIRVGLYPDNEDQFAIFDYSLGEDLTQYLVVINTDQNGNLEYMTMES